MKSRITIEVDFDNGNQPIIQVIQQQSEDVRDALVQSFLQSLAHTSRWCKINYKGHSAAYDKPNDEIGCKHHWQIIPITPQDIPEEIKLMQATLKEKSHMVK